jgi:MerR family copper efflux transcriptional regulator
VSTAYKIKAVAERSGFSAATLRYYEELGLLPETTRTDAGYRIYDDRALERLAFIARAKRLGCSLDEIVDLCTAWDGGTCGPVQDRLRAAVADKLAAAEQQIVELTTLTTDLQRSATALERHRPDGACDDSCGCVSDPPDDGPASQMIALTPTSTPAQSSVPIACTLEPGALRGQLDDWQRLLTHVATRDTIDGGIRATFAGSVPTNELIRLVAAEQDCCQFVRFAITVDTRGIALEVRAPANAEPIVHALFGTIG